MASTPNPYQRFLGDRDPQEVISQTPAILQELASKLTGEKAARSYAPGKWTGQQVLCHLADCEIAFSFRLRQALAESNHVIQPFNQDAWAQTYEGADLTLAVEVFGALRTWNVSLIHRLRPAVMDKPLSHPERGAMTFGTIVQTMAGHDLNHLAQLESLAGQP